MPIAAGTRLGPYEVIAPIGEMKSRVEYAAGHLFFVRDGTLMAQAFEPSSFKLSGEAIPIADNVAFNDRSGSASFSVAEDGTIAYQPFPTPHRLTLIDGSGRTLNTIGSGADFNTRFALLPDGSWIAAAAIIRCGSTGSPGQRRRG
jgi:hypothetical protein